MKGKLGMAEPEEHVPKSKPGGARTNVVCPMCDGNGGFYEDEAQVLSMYRERCGVFGCENDAVRVLEHKRDSSVLMGLCAFHVRRALAYLDNEQARKLIFPKEPTDA